MPQRPDIKALRARYGACPECPPITHNLIGACASVGIEHGRTTADELALWMETQHARHADRRLR